MTISRMVRALTQRGRECSRHYQAHRWAKRRRLFLDKTLTPTPATPPDLPSQSRPISNQQISHLHSEAYFGNTSQTSDITIHLRVIFPLGHREVSYCGTPFLVAEMVSLFLTTGLTDAGTILPEKSSNDATNKESSSLSSEPSLKGTSKKSRTRQSSSHHTPLPEVQFLPKTPS